MRGGGGTWKGKGRGTRSSWTAGVDNGALLVCEAFDHRQNRSYGLIPRDNYGPSAGEGNLWGFSFGFDEFREAHEEGSDYAGIRLSRLYGRGAKSS